MNISVQYLLPSPAHSQSPAISDKQSSHQSGPFATVEVSNYWAINKIILILLLFYYITPAAAVCRRADGYLPIYMPPKSIISTFARRGRAPVEFVPPHPSVPQLLNLIAQKNNYSHSATPSAD